MEQKDIQLIQAAKHGSKEAFTKIVHDYKNYVFQTAYGILQNRTDAEDAVQETFIKAYLSLHQIKDERSFPSWITTIASRLALDTIKKRNRASPISLDDDWVQVHDPQNDMEHIDDRMNLQRAFANLNSDHRTILILREIRGFDYQEIAQMLQIPIGTVRSRLHAARLQLKKTLERQPEGGA